MMNACSFLRIDTVLGAFYITATPTVLTAVHFDAQASAPRCFAEAREDGEHPLLQRAAAQIEEFLAGRRCAFDLPYASAGTPFQHRVWDAIARIGHGTTATYGQLASAIGCPRSVRAVGAATGRNPLAILIPCHRVIGSNGALTGYAGGLDRKHALLALEQAPMPLFARAA